MDFSPEKTAVDELLKELGQSCKLDKTDGTSASTIGVLLSAESSTEEQNSFMSKNSRTVYLSGKMKLVPEEGDTITFKPNVYAVNTVRAIAVGEGKSNVFAYRLVVGT